MNMDPTHNEYPDYINSIDFSTMSPNSSQFLETPTNQYQFDQLSPDFDFLSHQFTVPPESGDLFPPVSVSNNEEALYHDGDLLHIPSNVSPEAADSMSLDDEALFKYVNKMLMEEENIEPSPTVSYDPSAFRVTERSLYDILGQQYPVSPKKQPQQPLFVDQANQQQLLYDHQNAKSPDSFFSGSSGDVDASSSPSTGPSNSADSLWLSDCGEQKLSILQTPLPSDGVYQFNSHPDSNLQSSVSKTNSLSAFGYGISDSSVNQFMAQNIYTDSDSVLQFQRGLEEASKFLPKVNPLVIDLKSRRVSAEVHGHAPPTIADKKDKNERMNSSNSSNRRKGRRNTPNGSTERKKSPDGKGKKNHERRDVDSEEGRSSKQFAIYKDVQEVEDELSELLDKVLLFNHVGTCHSSEENAVDVQNEEIKSSQENGQPQASTGGGKKTRDKKQGKKKETIDLRNLLMLCAQAVSTNDFRTSTELLKQIRQHCSPFGDGSQRLAHCFANGLEARITGDVIKPQIRYNALASKQAAIEKLKAYQVSLSSCPFKKMAMFFMNKMIMKMAENATTLHIVDFGIMNGFQWPILIYKLSKRPGGPPKLRITGIDVPQAGFRPTEWIEDTGRRLARYCARFNVPFEFNAIASQQWESIKVEDLKVERNEMLAVNCMLQFKNLMDETVEENCPRDSVLKLIRSLKPDIFVHSICNGAYNSPFFVTRFREALFHYSALFDVYDVTLPRDSPQRLQFETGYYGVEAMNVIACEGAERNERAETYKQWQVRTQRAGLKPLPLDPETTELFRDQVKEKYHKDFEVDQDGDWLLQGWKGRIIYASSCWVSA